MISAVLRASDGLAIAPLELAKERRQETELEIELLVIFTEQ